MGCRASAIIPVYNAEKTLRRCVESLVLGHERQIEVILVEDRSKDKSFEVCQELAAEFSNVICIQNEINRGVSFTRNQGLAAATGEYILFTDSDDWVSAQYAQSLLKIPVPCPSVDSILSTRSVTRSKTIHGVMNGELCAKSLPNVFGSYQTNSCSNSFGTRSFGGM